MQRVVLLLPVPYEAFPQRAIVEELRAGGAVVIVDPPRTSYTRTARLPQPFASNVARKQARRLRKRLPDEPAAVAIFEPAQYPLARGLQLQAPGCELWYGGAPPDGDTRMEELHDAARDRADVVFTDLRDAFSAPDGPSAAHP